jgi:hypothetical protein
MSHQTMRFESESTKVLINGGDEFPKSFPTLQFLLHFSGLKERKFALFMTVILTLSSFVMLGSFINHTTHTKKLDWGLICHLSFSIHGCVIYILITRLLYLDLNPFNVMLKISKCTENAIRRKYTNGCMENQFQYMQTLSNFFSLVVIVFAVGNIIAVCVLFKNPLAIVMSKEFNLYLKLIGLAIWYFYSFAWFISIAIVCPPIYYLVKQVELFDQHMQKALTTSEEIIIDDLMIWHNDLYEANTVLQEAYSLLITCAAAIGSLFQLVLLMVSRSSCVSAYLPIYL